MILFDKEKQTFILRTKNTCYAFKIAHGRYLAHLYYGPEGGDIDFGYMPPKVSFMTTPQGMDDGDFSLETLPAEYAYYGTGDFRTTSLCIRTPDGDDNVMFYYESHRIFGGAEPLGGLPYARAEEGGQTLEISLFDGVCRCRLFLYYKVFEESDVITRYAKVVNESGAPVSVEKCMSLCLDLAGADYDVLTLYGCYGNEMNLRRNAVFSGNQQVASRRGATGHNYNPFFAVCERQADHSSGLVYGFNLVYSGNFLSEAELTSYMPASFVPYDMLRIQLGINPENLSFSLQSGECFYAPEAVMTCSARGIDGMSQNMHAFIRGHIMPPAAERPVVLNTWEACFYDINEEKLAAFAKECRDIGIDTLVVDDGWFGDRDDETSSLGDWTANAKKFKNGLKSFADKVCRYVRFGIWVEPEMLSENSDLYRRHPEWVLGRAERPHSAGRHQLVLDLSNPAVIAYVKDAFSKAFEGIDVSYIKWDMNRNLTELGSNERAMSAGETAYRYMLGVYGLLGWFREKFPRAVFETCSGGGGRFDLGMAAYSSMIWTSDNTCPAARARIQSGALTAYPAVLMSCHVSAPRGGGDEAEYNLRFVTAAQGMLGYELDLCRVPEKTKRLFAEQIKKYKAFRHVAERGKYAVAAERQDMRAYYYFTETEILFTVIGESGVFAGVADADENALYKEYFTGERVRGKDLKNGLLFSGKNGKIAEIRYYVKEN